MIKLLNANLLRLRKSKTLWFLLVFSIVFAYYVSLANYPDHNLESYLSQYILIVSFVIAIFSSIFISIEYAESTIHNKIIIGHKRIDIYLANLLTVLISTIFFYFVYSILIIQLVKSTASFKLPTKELVKEFSGLFVIMLSYTSIFTLISMTITNRVISTIVNIIIAFLIILLPFKCDSIVSIYYNHQYAKINFPETIDERWEYTYPTKQEAELSKKVLDITPLGRFFQLTGGDYEYYTKEPLLCLYSIGSLLLFNIAGIIMFQKKELK